jgi:hypothetical protein
MPRHTTAHIDRRRPRSLLRDTRGSIFVEALIFIPLLALLWTLLNYEYGINKTGMTTQERARTCAWQHASRGCTGSPPPGCNVSFAGKVDDIELRALSLGAYETIMAYLFFLSPTLQSLHGDEIHATDEAAVERPKVLGGTRHTRGSHALMCNTRTGEWELPVVFVLTVAFTVPTILL